MKESRSELVWQIVQCGVAIVIGYGFFVVFQDSTNEKVPVAAALLGGIGGSYLLMKLYVLIRYGRKAAKSMSWEP